MLALFFIVFAGKLADDNGFKGTQFGSDTVLDTPPLKTCQRSTEEGVKWVCTSTIADRPIKVAYLSSYGYFSTVVLTVSGTANCGVIKDVLVEAWGVPDKPNSYTEWYVWKDLPTLASWKQELVTSNCTIVIFNQWVHDEQEAARRNAASKSVDDL